MTKKLSIFKFILILIILFIFCIVLFILGAIYSLSSRSQYDIKDLKVKQNDIYLEAQWSDVKAPGYGIILLKNNKIRFSTAFSSKTNTFKVKLKDLDKEYTIIVLAKNNAGGLSSATIKRFKTHKIKQNIEVDDTIRGIKGDTIKLQTKSRSKLDYVSVNSNTASISSSGIIRFNKEGNTKFAIHAEETNQFLPDIKKINVIVYPDTLSTPKVSKKYNTNGVTLSWNEIKYANKYVLTKYDSYYKKYVKYKELDSTTLDVPRNLSKYRLVAIVNLNNKEVKSKAVDINIKSIADDIKTYNSSHNIGELNHSNMELVTKIDGYKGANIPQSMSLVKGNYIVSFSNKGDSKGAFVEYSSNGKLIRKKAVTGIGHANGSTYNPNTNRLYTVKTHGRTPKTWTRVCTTFDSSLNNKNTFSLPKNTSGIAYDESLGKYYLSKGNELYVTDLNFNVEKFLWKKIRYHHAQDIGAFDGIFYVCTWINGDKSYIDLYRSKDGAYLGSYYIPIGEIESCFIEIRDNKKYLLLLMNNDTKYGDCILRTKESIII